MAAPSQTVELPLTLRVSEQARAKLAERAAETGTDMAGYVSAIIEQNTKAPLSLEEISGPIYQRFLESGMTDEELSDQLEKEKHDAREFRSRFPHLRILDPVQFLRELAPPQP